VTHRLKHAHVRYGSSADMLGCMNLREARLQFAYA